MKKFHDALKTIYGPKSSGATRLLSAHGSTFLTDKDATLERWAVHFNSVLNRPSSANDNAINRLLVQTAGQITDWLSANFT